MKQISPSDKEQAILEGAKTIFFSLGYEGASMSQIAQQSGVSKGTLYNYFQNKADLFSAFVKHEAQKPLMVAMKQPDGEDISAALCRWGWQINTMLFSGVGWNIHRVVMAESGKFPELARAFYESGPATVMRNLRDWLVEQEQSGYLTIPDPEIAAEQFYSLCRTRYGLLRELRLLSDPDPDEMQHVIDASVKMFLCSYAPATPHGTTSAA